MTFLTKSYLEVLVAGQTATFVIQVS